MIQESFGRCLWRTNVPEDQASIQLNDDAYVYELHKALTSQINTRCNFASQEAAPILQHHAGHDGDDMCDLPMRVSHAIAYCLVFSQPSRSFPLYSKDLCLSVTDLIQEWPVRYTAVMTSSSGQMRRSANKGGNSTDVLPTNGYMHLCSNYLRFHKR